jgi:hypothetical protein
MLACQGSRRKQGKAAWEYIKFATGRSAPTIMVSGHRLLPATRLPAKDPKMLGDFYAQNPNHRVAIGQSAQHDRAGTPSPRNGSRSPT